MMISTEYQIVGKSVVDYSGVGRRHGAEDPGGAHAHLWVHQVQVQELLWVGVAESTVRQLFCTSGM